MFPARIDSVCPAGIGPITDDYDFFRRDLHCFTGTAGKGIGEPRSEGSQLPVQVFTAANSPPIIMPPVFRDREH